MTTRLVVPAMALVFAVLAGCSEVPTDVGEEAGGVLSAGAPVAALHGAVDVSGDWSWRRVEQLRMPRWFVEDVLSAIPGNELSAEGPNTIARCVGEGSMTLTQDGSEFEGALSRASGYCETRGGQRFQGPGAAFGLQLFDGRIHGLSLSYSVGNPNVTPCPQHAVVSGIEGGVATAFAGSGRCVIPGHPHSESVVPLDPPPGGTSVTLSFEAWRD